MSDNGLKRMLLNDALEAAEFQRLRKSGHFVRNAERLAAQRNAPPPPPQQIFAEPSVAILDRTEPTEVIAEPTDAGGLSIQPLADFDDQVRTFHDDPRQLRIDAIESALLEIAKRDTGEVADPEKRKAAEQRKAELVSLSLEYAAELEAENVAKCIRQDEFVIWLQGLHSGIVDAPVRFNAIMMLPAVAAQKRQPYLSAAGYFLQSRPFARTAVFTTGTRTKLRQVRSRVRELNRNLSRLNHELRAEFGVEIVLRSDELGTPESDENGERLDAGGIERDENGDPTFHVHAHVILHHVAGKQLPREEWDRLLRFVSKRWGYWWKDCGLLRDAAETVKYITKPRELQKLTRGEKAELCRQLRGLKLLQTMGALRDEIRSRYERRKRLDRAPTKDGRVWREVDDWNRRDAKRPADATEMALERVCGSPGDPFRVKDHERPECGAAPFKGERRTDDPDTRCTAILPPGFMPGSNVREPIAVFYGKRIDLDAGKNDRRCVLVADATRPQWEKGLAEAAEKSGRIIVHTCTPTVGPELPGFEVRRVLASRPIPDPAPV